MAGGCELSQDSQKSKTKGCLLMTTSDYKMRADERGKVTAKSLTCTTFFLLHE